MWNNLKVAFALTLNKNYIKQKSIQKRNEESRGET